MKTVGFYQNLPTHHGDALQDSEVAVPKLRDHDRLVEVKGVSVNHVDTKIRAHGDVPSDAARILGWDAVGIVQATGHLATLFKPSDRVLYTGDITRPGSNSEWHPVDERIVGPMPRSLDFAKASLPLTAITAWELCSTARDYTKPIRRKHRVAGDRCRWRRAFRPYQAGVQTERHHYHRHHVTVRKTRSGVGE